MPLSIFAVSLCRIISGADFSVLDAWRGYCAFQASS